MEKELTLVIQLIDEENVLVSGPIVILKEELRVDHQISISLLIILIIIGFRRDIFNRRKRLGPPNQKG